MAIIKSLIGPIASIIDKIIPDPEARAKAKLELLALEGRQDMEVLNRQIAAILAEAKSPDPWTSRARPSFLYVIYVIILWSIPMGIIAAYSPDTAQSIAHGMNSYLRGIPDAMWGLFGTGYLGYTAARQWGKVKGVDR